MYALQHCIQLGNTWNNSIKLAAICSFIVILTACIIIIAALHTAGKHMENSIVAAYVALLLF